ncbi:MAG: single-stranded-DNA-specific exonuclease RecJ [Pseudomonadota bacterium]
MSLAHALVNDAGFTPPALPDHQGSASGRRWTLRETSARDALAIAQREDIDIVVAHALTARGVDQANAADYLNPSLRASLPDPFVLADMKEAVGCLSQAIIEKSGVGVFGDYDVDGTTASSILHLYFRALGRTAPVYLPDRILEGYGPSLDAFKSLKEQGAEIVVTVDCGAAAHEVIAAAAGEGLKTVVVDHHLMQGPPPSSAVAVVNPNRPDDVSGLGNLSAAGVAFMLVVALNRALRDAGFFASRPEPNLLQFLDLAALGLVCDVMEMTGLTRVIVSQGLRVMEQRGNPGLKALARAAGAKGRPSPYHLGFLIGPRINAAGRIGHANLAFRLLTVDDPVEAQKLADRLHVLNAERQEIERAVQEAAIAQIEKKALESAPVIVVADEGWHPGVIGIVAGRLKEKYDRPAIVIGADKGIGKGSGRSIAGVDLGAAINQARADGLLTAGGGHAMAAGLTIDTDKIAAFADYLGDRLGAAVNEALANRKLMIDGVVAASAVARPLVDQIDNAGPFGPGNPEPVFVLADMRIEKLRTVGAGHLSFNLVSPTGETVRAIAFRAADEPLGAMLTSGARLHVAGKIKADEWRGGDATQFQVSDAARAI